MASCKDSEQFRDMKHSASASEQLSQCDPDDAAEEPQNAMGKSNKPGKFRRTALTFFGVRKGICILPSFFGGRSRGQSRWSSKKGIGRSKTHDGLSKVGLDDNQRSGNSSASDLEFHSQRDSVGEIHRNCQSECNQPAADHKCLSLTRHKRGLRSFFHSIKHHRNNKNAGLEKNEKTRTSSLPCKHEETTVKDDPSWYVTECLVSEPDVPDLENVSVVPECIETDAPPSDKSVLTQESPKSVPDCETPNGSNPVCSMADICGEYEESSGRSESNMNPQTSLQPSNKNETPAGSSDQLNLMFGDVASLKSFDSLTGCGDIIADQDDDSITESTVSGERSRNGGKRASCYLTYQGGGEEMASPDDFDESCLHDFWGGDAAEEACYNCNEDQAGDLTATLSSSSHHMDLMSSNSAQQASGMDSSSMADVLTPQSEHQESAPNSDEGYYDSTTPGPEEGQEKVERMRADRLPRDSYSGDALYELFAPDESLISPHYEHKSKLPSSKPGSFSGESGNVSNSAFIPDMDRLQLNAELYNVQDYLAMPGVCSKPQEAAQQFSQQNEGLNKNANLNLKAQAFVNKNNMNAEESDEEENLFTSVEKRAKSVTSESENGHGNAGLEDGSDPDFETFCEPKEQHLEENKPVALPYRNINPHSTECSNDLDDGQTVCFSQALVDYTKHSQLLSNASHRVDGLEMNSAFTPNMQALPTIVTFDVVDLHNEGEYDEQIHMDLEEDISSPYQEFEESYLQKDAFAECDYQMLDLCEQNLFSNAWAIASLPRHMGLTRVSQSLPSPLSLDRRSRSLDTDGLELNVPDEHRESRTRTVFCPQMEMDCKKDSFPYCKRNVLASASDNSCVMSLSWQTKSDMALRFPETEAGVPEKGQSVCQNQANRKIFSSSSSSDFSTSKSHPCSDMSDGDLHLQSTEPCDRPCRLPLQTDSCLPHSTFVFSGNVGESLSGRRVPSSDKAVDEVFCAADTNLQSYKQGDKSRQVAWEGMCKSGCPANSGSP